MNDFFSLKCRFIGSYQDVPSMLQGLTRFLKESAKVYRGKEEDAGH